MTTRLGRKLVDGGLKEVLVPSSELIGRFVARDIVNGGNRRDLCGSR